MNIEEKRKIVDKIKKMSKEVHLEIYYFLINNTDNSYTKNQNGVFINLNNLDDQVLLKLQEMTDFYDKNELNFREHHKI